MNSPVSRDFARLWPLLLLVIVVIAFALYLPGCQNIFKVPIIRLTKVLEITPNVRSNSFLCPESLNTKLVLAIPRGLMNTNKGPAKLTILANHKSVLVLQLDPISLTPCSSVGTSSDGQELDGYTIENTNAPAQKWEMSSYIQSGRSYEITVENLPMGSSIWLHQMYPSGWMMPFGVGKYLKNRRIGQLPAAPPVPTR